MREQVPRRDIPLHQGSKPGETQQEAFIRIMDDLQRAEWRKVWGVK